MGVNGPKRDAPAFVVRAFWRSSCGRTLSFKTKWCSNCGDEQPGRDADLLLEQLDELPVQKHAELRLRLSGSYGRTEEVFDDAEEWAS